MGNVLHRTSKQYLKSVNTPDFGDPPWLVNPDVQTLIDAGIITRHWKIELDDTVVEMNASEKTAADQAVQKLNLASDRTPDFDGVPKAPANGVGTHTLTITKLDLAGNAVGVGTEIVEIQSNVPIPISKTDPTLVAGTITVEIGPTKQVGDIEITCVDPASVLKVSDPLKIRFRSSVGSPEAPFPIGYIEGAALARTTNNNVEAGTTGERSVVRDSTNTFDIDWTGILTGVMPTDLDTGTEVADTWYAVHVLGDSTETNTPKLLFSVSATAPTMPGTHDKFRRIGWVRNNASSQFVPFNQLIIGSTRRYHFDLSVPNRRILQNGQATAYTAVDASAFIPPGSRNFVAEVGFATGTAGAQGDDVKIRFPGHTAGSLFRVRIGVVSGQKTFTCCEIPVDANRQFEYQVDQGGASQNVVDFAMVAFDDRL